MEKFTVHLIVLTIAIAGLVGWVVNIMALIDGNMGFSMMLVRAAGIFIAPLGAVLGYI